MLLSILLLHVIPAQTAPASQPSTVRIAHGDLIAVFRDNRESPAALSGIDSLFNIREAPDFDAFDPDSRGSSAGMNFEHIICGHENVQNAFSPRHGPFPMSVLPDGRSVRLTRRAEDDPWSVDSTLTYTLTVPHYIDVDFRCRPRDARKFGERGYAILFFCHYMNDVADAALRFRGIEREGGPESWIAADAPPGPPHWNQGGTYHHRDAQALEHDADVRFNLNHWTYDYPRYTLPFYYGRAARNMTLILMFDRAWTPRDEIRLSLFKFKLKKWPRPAWDFQYVIRRVQEGQEYGFKARLVWKRFVSESDCLAEYQRWERACSTQSQPE